MMSRAIENWITLTPAERFHLSERFLCVCSESEAIKSVSMEYLN